jgi:DNA-binding CsgD family transcriptional regulator
MLTIRPWRCCRRSRSSRISSLNNSDNRTETRRTCSRFREQVIGFGNAFSDGVRGVAQGEAVCPAKFCKVLFQALASESNQQAAIAEQRAGMRFELTQRQRQLMSLVAMGLSNKEIAANLNLSEFTVKNHIYRVMKQVDAQNRHEACHLIRAGESQEENWQSLPLR